MRLMIEMTGGEVRHRIAYPLIIETMSGSVWQTSRRRRRWAEEFTAEERKACSKLKTQAYTWYLRTGVPESVVMSYGTMKLWKKLEAFCASL